MTTVKTYEQRMNKWLEALRSGKYEQGTIYLRRKDNKFCCLGVACDLYDDRLWTESALDYFKFKSTEYDKPISSLPDRVQNYYGLKSWDGKVDNTGVSLVYLNDEKGYSFLEIADFIEKHKEELFTWAK